MRAVRLGTYVGHVVYYARRLLRRKELCWVEWMSAVLCVEEIGWIAREWCVASAGGYGSDSNMLFHSRASKLKLKPKWWCG